MENIPGGIGSGYSKKESQQEAAHETLKMIKSDSQFIDLIYIAKQEREKAEGAEAKIDNQANAQEATEGAEPSSDSSEEVAEKVAVPQTENSQTDNMQPTEEVETKA